MRSDAALRIFWAMQQEALCHNYMVGLTADDLRIVYHWLEHYEHAYVRRWPDFQIRRQDWRN